MCEKKILNDRIEFDETIEMYAGKARDLVCNSVKNFFLSVPYGIKEARNYSKSDIGLLTLSLAPTVILNEFGIIPLAYAAISYSMTAFSFRGFKFVANKWLFDKAMKECSIMTDNNKYPKLKSVKYEGLRKTFIINSSVGVSKIKMNGTKLKKANICLTEIEQQKDKILLHTEKKGKLPEEIREIARFLEVFESLDLDIKVKDFESSDYFIDVYFNTEIYFNKLQSMIDELKHRLKVDNLTIVTDKKYDFKLSIKKTVKKKNTFLHNWDSEEVQTKIKNMEIPVLMGVNCDTGKLALYDVAKDMYHSLVAGSTGWGKSVLIQNICSSILLADRDYIECYFFDTKGTELNLYEGLHNVYFEKDLNKIVNGLENLVIEMNARNSKINKNRFLNNVFDWNKAYPSEKMDYKIIVVEEISFFMESADKKLNARFKSAIVKLAQLGRSAGMWLYITTQNPVKEVIFGELKANVDTRAGCKTTDKTKSRTILDNNMCTTITEKGKYVLQNKGTNILHKSFWIQEEERKIIYFRLKEYEEKKVAKLEKSEITNNPVGLMKNEAHPDKIEIHNHYNLYLFYKNIQQENGKLPIKKELVELTGLSDWKLRSLHDRLKAEGKLINQGNDLILIDDVDELAQRRIKEI